MTGHVASAGEAHERPGARWSWLLPAGTFLAGCALGGTLVGVGAVGGDEPAELAASAAAADPDAEREPSDRAGDEAPGNGDPGLYVRVPDSCVQTADDATALVEHVDLVVAAVADLEPETLRQTVDEVQKIRDRVQRVAQECREQAALRMQDDAAAAPTRSP